MRGQGGAGNNVIMMIPGAAGGSSQRIPLPGLYTISGLPNNRVFFIFSFQCAITMESSHRFLKVHIFLALIANFGIGLLVSDVKQNISINAMKNGYMPI